MKRLSHLMMKKWRETERWKERRRSEPCGSAAEVEEKRCTRVAESAARDTGNTTPRRRSEPCGQEAEEEGEEERPKMEERQRRKSEPSVRPDEQERRTTQTDGWMGGEEEEKKKKGRRRRRKSESGLPLAAEGRAAPGQGDEDGGGGRWGETDARTDRQSLRRRSEPCWALVLQLPPLSDGKRKELLERRMGRKTGRKVDRKPGMTEGQADRKQEVDRKLYRRKSEPGPPGVSEYNNQLDVLYIRVITYVFCSI